MVSILFGGAYLLTKDPRRSGFIAFLILVWALVYGNAFNIFFSPLLSYLHVASSIVNYWLFLVLWTLGFLFLGSSFLWQKIARNREWPAYLNLVTIGILLFFGYNLIRIETHAFISSSDFPPRGSAAL